MNQLVPISSPALPALVAAAGERAGMRFLEFFAANICNPHTRRAYARAAYEFLGWCACVGVPSIAAVQPVHVAAWIADDAEKANYRLPREPKLCAKFCRTSLGFCSGFAAHRDLLREDFDHAKLLVRLQTKSDRTVGDALCRHATRRFDPDLCRRWCRREHHYNKKDSA
jgi:hypothetical protein